MSTMNSFPFNRLPVELQREIFLNAVTLHSRDSLELILVAKRVYSWVLPSIYELVVLGAHDAFLFLRTTNSKPHEFFASRVKKLCLTVSVGAQNARRILSICTGVVDLAFWVDHLNAYPDGSLMGYLAPLPLKRLSIELMHFKSLFSGVQSKLSWCDTLTHLDLVFWAHETAPDAPHLAEISNLTHLSLRLRHSCPTATSISSILSFCRRLKVLIIFDDPDLSEVEEICTPLDPRIVCMPYPVNIVKDWEAQARDESHCIWSRAEDLVRSNISKRSKSTHVV